MSRIIHDLHAWLRNKEARLMSLRFDLEVKSMPDHMITYEQRALITTALQRVSEAEDAVREALAVTPVFKGES